MTNSLNEMVIQCPYCGENFTTLVDPEEAGNEYIEDCQVCCKPIVFMVVGDAIEGITVEVCSEDD